MIDYMLSNSFQADERLSDAMLYAALRQELGDKLSPFEAGRYHKGDRPLWGSDPYSLMSVRIKEATDAYLEPAVLRALGGAVVVPRHEVQDLMDANTRQGHGSILRNMRSPGDRLRWCQPGDRFTQHSSAIGSDDQMSFPILVQPNFDLVYLRRFLIVAGEIAADTPYRFCEEDPCLLMDPENRKKQALDFMKDLEIADPRILEMQQSAAEALLKDYPLPSGTLDVGVVTVAGVPVSAVVESVTAARPGAFSILFADPVAYARKIALHLDDIEPSLREAHPISDEVSMIVAGLNPVYSLG